MSCRKAFSAVTRWRMPASSVCQSLAGMMRGTVSNGISRSAPESSPYTAKVMPTRWNIRSASARLRASVCGDCECSQWAKSR
ncbi:hypothetical protein D3C78_1369530 [compost metagenome]